MVSSVVHFALTGWKWTACGTHTRFPKHGPTHWSSVWSRVNCQWCYEEVWGIRPDVYCAACNKVVPMRVGQGTHFHHSKASKQLT